MSLSQLFTSVNCQNFRTLIEFDEERGNRDNDEEKYSELEKKVASAQNVTEFNNAQVKFYYL